MDTDTATVSPRATTSQDAGNGATGNGDAGTDLLRQMDELFQKRLAEERTRISAEASETAFRNSQRLIDQHLARINPVLAQINPLAQSVQRIEGHFTQATEADLEPSERTNRELQRRLDEAQRFGQAAHFNSYQQAAMVAVYDLLNDFGIKKADARIDWRQELYGSNPTQWQLEMDRQINRLAVEDERGKHRTSQESQASTTERREAQLVERARAEARNERRDAAPRVETTSPNGARRDYFQDMDELYRTDRKAWAKITSANAKRAARGEVTTADQLSARSA